MADLPPLPPRRSVTAGRPLPAKVAQGAASVAPVAAVPAPAAAPALASAAPAPAPAARLAKPDARPMRWAFGAGAVAAVSILTVGFVKPDFTGSEEQATANDNATEQTTVASNPRSRARVKHVTRYVYLERGERAPRGATVIDAGQAPGQRNQPRADSPENRQTENAARANRPTNNQPRTNRPAVNQPANNDRPAADPNLRPEQPPRTPTHQSGG